MSACQDVRDIISDDQLSAFVIVVRPKFGLRIDEYERCKSLLISYFDVNRISIVMEDAGQGPDAFHLDAVVVCRGQHRAKNIKRILYREIWNCNDKSKFGHFQPKIARSSNEIIYRRSVCVKSLTKEDYLYRLGYNIKEQYHMRRELNGVDKTGHFLVKYLQIVLPNRPAANHSDGISFEEFYNAQEEYKKFCNTTKKRKADSCVMLNKTMWDIHVYDYMSRRRISNVKEALTEMIKDHNYWFPMLNNNIRHLILQGRMYDWQPKELYFETPDSIAQQIIDYWRDKF